MCGKGRPEGPYPLPDSVRRSDQFPPETSGADQCNQRIRDFIDPLHWFPVATDRIVGLSPKVGRGLICLNKTGSVE